MISIGYSNLAPNTFSVYSARMRIKIDNIDSKDALAPFLIYKALNIITGDFYIGATRQGLQNRSKQHLADFKYGLSACRKFQAAVTKYGADNFYWEVIATASSFEELMQKEFELVDTLKPDYNLCAGGMQSPSGMLGKTHSVKTKNRLRELGLASIDKFRLYQHLGPASLRKQVVCLNTGEVFSCTREAAEAKNVNQVSLIYVCNRSPNRKTCGKGLVFRYFGDHLGGKEEADRILATKPKKQIKVNKVDWMGSVCGRPKKIICITDKVEFYSLTEAAKHYGIHFGLISDVCRGKQKTTSGLQFKYV